MTFNRQKFINDLRYLATLEIPWLHQGSNPAIGFDCVGVVKYAVELQMPLPDELAFEFTHYHRPPNGRHMLEIMRRWLPEIQKEQLQPADLIVYYVRKNPCHMAIQMPEGIAEAFESQGISSFLIKPPDLTRRIAACFRIPDFN